LGSNELAIVCTVGVSPSSRFRGGSNPVTVTDERRWTRGQRQNGPEQANAADEAQGNVSLPPYRP
jgi:hypothetical protein